MKKYIPHFIITVLALCVGYVAGGLVASKKATQEAYYASIMHLAHAKNYLDVGNKEKAREALSIGISGSLGAIKTFDEHFQAGMIFVIPDSEFLFSQKDKDGIVKSIDGPSACMIQKNTEPNQAPETTILTVTDRAPSSTLRASLNVYYVSA